MNKSRADNFFEITLIKQRVKLLVENSTFERGFAFERIKGYMSANIEIFSGIVGFCTALVFTKNNIKNPVQTILD